VPPEPLDAAIIFATVGALVPMALKAVRKGGRVVCAGIHMSDIPGFPYAWLWEERQLLSVANLTRQDGLDFLRQAPAMGIVAHTTVYPLRKANDALADLRAGRFDGAPVGRNTRSFAKGVRLDRALSAGSGWRAAGAAPGAVFSVLPAAVRRRLRADADIRGVSADGQSGGGISVWHGAGRVAPAARAVRDHLVGARSVVA
jgi:hypothetical protein